MSNSTDTPEPICYATCLDGQIQYSEFCVASTPDDFDISDLEEGVEIEPLYSRAAIRMLTDKLSRLTAELERVKGDAERYRWLRMQVTHIDFIPIAQVVWKRDNNPHEKWVNLVDGNALDTAIDRAIAEKGKT